MKRKFKRRLRTIIESRRERRLQDAYEQLLETVEGKRQNINVHKIPKSSH